MVLPSCFYLKKTGQRGIQTWKLPESLDNPQDREVAVAWTGEVEGVGDKFLSPAKYSSLVKFHRVAAYMWRFVCNTRRAKPDRRFGPTLVEELEQG